MVLVHLKGKSEDNQILFETTAGIENEELIRQLVTAQNTRLRILRLAAACEELAQYGVMKPDNEHGYTEEQLEEALAKSKISEAGGDPSGDPTGRRTGEPPKAELADVINRTIAEAREAVSHKKVALKATTSQAELDELVERLRGAVMIAFPQGLPDFDPVQIILDNEEDLANSPAANEVYDPEDAKLWFVSKNLARGKLLSDFIGKNEKTKIVAKLTRGSANGPPAREAQSNSESQREMMAWMHRRAEQLKKLEEDEDESHNNAPWAANNSLKSSFNGIGNVSFRPS